MFSDHLNKFELESMDWTVVWYLYWFCGLENWHEVGVVSYFLKHLQHGNFIQTKSLKLINDEEKWASRMQWNSNRWEIWLNKGLDKVFYSKHTVLLHIWNHFKTSYYRKEILRVA